MAALLTALIAFNIALYKRVSELSVMTPSENKTDTPAEKILNSENVLLREEIKENLKSLEKKIETSVHGIERKLDGSLQNFKLETKNELVGNHESTNREISKSVNQIRNEMISKMTNFDIAPLLKKFDHLFLYSLHFGIQNNVHISHFAGFFYAYKKPYSHITTGTEMDEIKNSCSLTTILCLGGVDNKNQVLRVVSCGFCSVVLSKRHRNTPYHHNGAYWYYTPDVENSRSMGFAPHPFINQNNADIADKLNNQRVSWQLNEMSGGWRLGSLLDLDNSTNYDKVIIKKDL